jgi:hypothetical protein
VTVTSAGYAVAAIYPDEPIEIVLTRSGRPDLRLVQTFSAGVSVQDLDFSTGTLANGSPIPSASP